LRYVCNFGDIELRQPVGCSGLYSPWPELLDAVTIGGGHLLKHSKIEAGIKARATC